MATRTEIREAVNVRIQSLFSKTFAFAPPSIYEDQLPAAAIYFDDGETERTYGDERADTNGRLIIEIKMNASSANANIDAELDQRASAVEAVFKADTTLGGLVEYISRIGFSYERDPETTICGINLVCAVIYEDED